MTKSICTVVSFDGSSSSGYKIAMQHIDGSKVTLTVLAVITKAGASYIPSQRLSEMSELNGRLATEESVVAGGKTKRSQHEN